MAVYPGQEVRHPGVDAREALLGTLVAKGHHPDQVVLGAVLRSEDRVEQRPSGVSLPKRVNATEHTGDTDCRKTNTEIILFSSE